MKNNLIDKLFQGLFVAAFVAIVAIGLMITFPKYRQAKGLDKTCADLQYRIDLKKKQIRFKTDREFVEGLARENRRAFPGEIVFTFDD